MTPPPPPPQKKSARSNRTPGWIRRQLGRINPFQFLENLHLDARQVNLLIYSLVGLLALVLASFFTIAPEGLFARMEISRQIQIRRMENEELRAALDDLRGEIERLKSDPEYIEMVARNELGLARPGESLYKYRD